MIESKMRMIDTFFDFFHRNGDKRILVCYGGAGSGKSHSVAQNIILKMLEGDNIRILVTRKTLPSLKMTAYRLILDMLNMYGIPYKLNKSELTITVNNNEIWFKSLDDPEKIKSAELNYVWIEEATDITREDFMQLNLRLRRQQQGTNQMYLTFNPIDAYHWIIQDIVQGNREDTAVHHSTYLHNQHLSDEYRRQLEDLINTDENFYRVYALGEPGVLQNIIYSKYVIEEWTVAARLTEGGFDAYGVDFGYNNPSAVVGIRHYDGEYYVQELLYQDHLTNTDLIKWMESNLDSTVPMYADSAEPDRIEEISRAGFNVHPAKKSVKDGIDFVKARRLHITPDSVNLVKEIRNYKYREDRDGRVLDEPVKFMDHIMDSLRYAIFTMNVGVSSVPLDYAVGGSSVDFGYGGGLPRL